MKLTDADVVLILKTAAGLHGSAARRARLIAPIFGVSPWTVLDILDGDTHVPLAQAFRQKQAQA